jgi:hypothetical protein
LFLYGVILFRYACVASHDFLDCGHRGIVLDGRHIAAVAVYDDVARAVDHVDVLVIPGMRAEKFMA